VASFWILGANAAESVERITLSIFRRRFN